MVVRRGTRGGRRIQFEGGRNVEQVRRGEFCKTGDITMTRTIHVCAPQVALDEYRRLNWSGIFSECRVFINLAYLLFYDEIFDTSVAGQ
jgi:hypothetical protein